MTRALPATLDPKIERLKALRLAAGRLERVARAVPRTYSLGDTLQFGKNVGRTVEEAIDEDRGWITWALGEGVIDLDEGAMLAYHSEEPRR